MPVEGAGVLSMSITINSGDDLDQSAHHPLLVITRDKPTGDVLERAMRPWIEDPPWANKHIRITGFRLGGEYRGWLEAKPIVEAIKSPLALSANPGMRRSFLGPETLFHCNGVDAVRIMDCASFERCSKRVVGSFRLPAEASR